MALRDVRGSSLPRLHGATTLAERNKSVPFFLDHMFSLDMPNMLPSPAIVIAANAEAQEARPTERVLGICLPIAYVAPGSEPNVLAGAMIGNPSSSAAYYLSVYEKLEVKDLPPVTSFELVKAPLHTKLVLSKNAADEDAMYFVADPGYVGSDYAELRVNVEGLIVKLAYYIHVTKADLNSRDGLPQFCPKEPYWKISMSERKDGFRKDGVTGKTGSGLAR